MNRQRYAYSIINLKNKVFKKAKDVIGKGKGAIWFHNKIIEYANRVAILERDYSACMSYHVLIGSSDGGEEISPIIDFFEICSVKNFCLMTLSELNQLERNSQ